MSTLTLKYTLTETGRKNAFAATGDLPGHRQIATYDMTQVTSEQRANLVEYTGTKLEINWHGSFPEPPKFDTAPTVSELESAILEYTKKCDDFRRTRLEKKIAGYINALHEHVSKRHPELAPYATLEESEKKDALRLGIELRNYQESLADYLDLRPTFRREAAEKLAAIAAAKAAREAKRDARKAELKAMKTAWIEQYGSDHLKRACLDEGYDCQRMYVNERAAVESPGFTADIGNDADWKDRSCPSPEALDAVDTARKFGLGEPLVVWLTHPPAKRDDYYYDEYEAREAVVIRGYLDNYDLIQVV